jgi:Bacterial Ig-like domain (group 1)
MRIDRMHKPFTAALLCLFVALATGCGGQDDAFTTPPITDQPGAALATLALLTSSPQLPSDGALPVNLTAQVKDASNNLVSDVAVSFSADSGSLAVTQAITDTTGQALATLTTLGNPTNRTITVTASVTDGTNTLTDTVTVNVIGTQLTITGPTNLSLGDVGNYSVKLVNAAGNGIPNETVTLTSAAGNALSTTTLETDSAGAAQFTMTASQGDDVLSAEALGITTTRTVAVSTDSFSFLAPGSGTEIPLNTDTTVTVRWTQAGVPVAGQQINLSTTRGVLNPTSALTNASGEATVSIRSANAGGASLTASTDNGPSTQRAVEFIATVPDSLEVQADPFTIAPNEQATITAILRDPNNNLVKNQVVVFQLDDVTGGSLAVGSAETDSQGRAQTVYTASSSTSASGGVVITAFVQGAVGITDSTALTVARRQVFFTFGTGNEMSEPNPATYSVPFVIVVTDADGNGVAGATLQLSLLSTHYLKGYWVADAVNDRWAAVTTATCDDEDVNHNGVLDFGEDYNSNNHVEAGNIAAINAGATTGDDGTVLVNVVYPQVYGAWLDVRLGVKATVQGTEFGESLTFILPVIASDVDSLDTAPPGVLVPPDPEPMNNLPDGGLVSPFGYNDDCAIATAPLPLP